MRRILFATVVLCSLVLSSCKKEAPKEATKEVVTETLSPVEAYGQLQVKGRYLCDEKGDTVVLRGVSFGWHNLWPDFYNAEAVNWLKEDWKPTILRAAMGLHIENNYFENPEFAVKCVETVVDEAIKEGLYVIIDWHAHDIFLDEAKAFFATMAQKYGEYPNVMYELFNEPTDKHSWQDVKTYAEELIAEIRKYDPDNIILVGTPNWDQRVDLAAEDPITGYENIMYTFHFYAATHKEYERGCLVKALELGLPVFVSESAGCEHTGDGYLDVESWTNWIEFLEQEKIGWVIWSISDKVETCSMILETGRYTGGWEEEALRPSGVKTREFLREYNKAF